MSGLNYGYAVLDHGGPHVYLDSGEEVTARCRRIEILPDRLARAVLLKSGHNGLPFYDPERDEVAWELLHLRRIGDWSCNVPGGPRNGQSAPDTTDDPIPTQALVGSEEG